jgi:hypothetical protein
VRRRRDDSPAAVLVGDSERSAVSLTLRVPDGFFNVIEGGGVSATLLITPNEARGFAARLDAVAEAADAAGSPLCVRSRPHCRVNLSLGQVRAIRGKITPAVDN